MPKGKTGKRNNKIKKANAAAELESLNINQQEATDKIAKGLVPAKGPSDGKIKYDKDTDEVTIKQADGEEIKIRPEQAIEPDTLPVKEEDFWGTVSKLNILRVSDVSNPLVDLKRALTLAKPADDGKKYDMAGGTCSALITPLHWRKMGASSWRCSLLSLVEGDLFSNIKVTCFSKFQELVPFAKLMVAMNGHAVWEGPLTHSVMNFPMCIPRFCLMSCNLEMIVENVKDVQKLIGHSFKIDHDSYMMGDDLKKRWVKRLDALLYFESNYQTLSTNTESDEAPVIKKREYVVDISYGNVKRIVPGNRSTYEKISQDEETKREKQLELLKKAREENRPNFPDPKM